MNICAASLCRRFSRKDAKTQSDSDAGRYHAIKLEVTKISTNSIKKNARRIVGWIIVAKFVAIIVFADFFSLYDYRQQSRTEPSAPATTVHFSGGGPAIYPKKLSDPLRLIYEEDRTRLYRIELFVRGYQYELLGLIPTDVHLFGVEKAEEAPRLNILGTDNLGRDRFSRLLHAVKFSLIVCSIGVVLASFIGIIIGVTSGYSTRFVDTVFMGATDAMLSLPTLILILAARAAFPLELPPMRAALLLLLIFALTGWAEMARLARGLVVATREREFIAAAVATGVTQFRILFRHVLPNISAPLITQAMLMLPAFLVAEIALSYLGVGLQEPEASLGNMLTAASDLNQLRQHPVIILSPAIVIFIFVLGIRLLSDNKRTGTGSAAPSL